MRIRVVVKDGEGINYFDEGRYTLEELQDLMDELDIRIAYGLSKGRRELKYWIEDIRG